MEDYYYEGIGEIMDAHEAKGGYFFSDGAMKSFKSKIYPEVYGGRYFVTYEKSVPSYEGRRLGFKSFSGWTVRVAYADGDIGTFGEMMEHKTLKDAQEAAKKAAMLIHS